MVRYIARMEPLASTPAAVVVAALGPTIQRYLTGDLRAAGGSMASPAAKAPAGFTR